MCVFCDALLAVLLCRQQLGFCPSAFLQELVVKYLVHCLLNTRCHLKTAPRALPPSMSCDGRKSTPGRLASRITPAIAPALSYFGAFTKAQERPWSPEDPEGAIIMTVAENKLSADLIHEKLLKVGPCPVEVLFYPQDWRGISKLTSALARMLQTAFMKGITVDPTHIIVGAGAGAILDNLFYALAEPGEGVLIPTPYYPAFDNDLQVKNRVIPVGFELSEGKDVAQQLSTAAAASAAAGHPIRALLVTNPNNPLGTSYSRQLLLDCLRWCLQHEVHLVSDEIYGLSTWGEGVEFTSLEVIAQQEAAALPGGGELCRELLHVVFGTSKDFCASGLRLGCLHSCNPTLHRAFNNLAYFFGASNMVQWLVARMLEDEEWLHSYIAENNRRLRHAYGLLSGALTAADIPFVEANSAMFCWVDLRSALTESTWEAEQELWNQLVQECGVLITPGHNCHAPEPGFFRFCWAWVPAEALPEAVARISKLLQKRQRGANGAVATGGSA